MECINYKTRFAFHNNQLIYMIDHLWEVHEEAAKLSIPLLVKIVVLALTKVRGFNSGITPTLPSGLGKKPV